MSTNNGHYLENQDMIEYQTKIDWSIGRMLRSMLNLKGEPIDNSGKDSSWISRNLFWVSEIECNFYKNCCLNKDEDLLKILRITYGKYQVKMNVQFFQI